MRKYEARILKEGREPAAIGNRGDAGVSTGGGVGAGPSASAQAPADRRPIVAADLAVHFPTLATPLPEEPPEGWIATDFDGARAIFNGCVPTPGPVVSRT